MRSTSKPAPAQNSATGGHKPRRYVAFGVPSDDHHHRSSGISDIDANITHLRKGRYRPCCFACCVGTCIGLFTFIIILFIICISYIAFLKAGKPQVNVRRLSITKLQQVDNNIQGMNVAVISLGVRVSNKNEKLNLLYGPLTVDVFTGKDVKLGRTRVEGFSHKPHNDTDLDMTMTLDNAKVNTQVVDQLNMNANQMVVDVYISGNFGMKVGRFQVTAVPFLSSCRQINQTDMDYGRSQGCDFKIFAFR